MISNRIVAAAVMFALGTQTTFAESMICKNPGREYYLVYEPGAEAVVINPDSDHSTWKVLSNLFDDTQHIVIVDLGHPGMSGQVHFRPYRKVEIFSSGQLVQTDGCKS
ncbi:hypothetical protein JP74_00445 [Devosia sp. 17-2-E-8]|nr:hypothetical protein JP74_00445 [Devosia sp. 17-2-E-8]